MDKQVLVVEDDAAILEFLCRVLLDQGLKVLTASTALEAFQKFSSSVKIIISDLELSGKNGLWLLKAVRERDARVQFILMSSNVDPDIIAEAKRYEVTEFIRKPLGIEEFSSIVDSLLQA